MPLVYCARGQLPLVIRHWREDNLSIFLYSKSVHTMFALSEQLRQFFDNVSTAKLP